MKLSGLPFSCGVSLVCHAVAFGLFTHAGRGLRQAELRLEDLPLTMVLLATPEASAVQPAAIASATATAPPVEIVQPLSEVKPPPPLPVEKRPAAIVALPEPIVLQSQPPLPTIVAAVTTATPNPASVGGGSSRRPGLDRTTTQAQSGDRAHADYRRNPKPAYPPAARRRQQEGLVLLSVNVTTQGRANRVVLKRSSGFTLLDEAALQTVRDWEFEPARIGTLAVESEIQVPIRFQLGD